MLAPKEPDEGKMAPWRQGPHGSAGGPGDTSGPGTLPWASGLRIRHTHFNAA